MANVERVDEVEIEAEVDEEVEVEVDEDEEKEERKEKAELKHKPSTPQPLCKAVRCDDVEGMTLEEALREVGEVEEVADGIYATPYEFKRISPSMLNEYEFCPRLLWLEAREGKKFMTADSIVAAVKGKRLHERYEKAFADADDVMVEYKVESGEFAGIVDLVLIRDGGLVPVEVKTGDEKESHKRQLQAYIALLEAPSGYLVYGDRVVAVDPDPSVLDELKKIGEVMRSPRPPPPARECRQCKYRTICKTLVAKHTSMSLTQFT